jgi:hypothetical protein
MKECDLNIHNSVKVSLQKVTQDRAPQWREESLVAVIEFIPYTEVAVTLKGAKSLKSKLEDLIKKADKVVINHPELPLK